MGFCERDLAKTEEIKKRRYRAEHQRTFDGKKRKKREWVNFRRAVKKVGQAVQAPPQVSQGDVPSCKKRERWGGKKRAPPKS